MKPPQPKAHLRFEYDDGSSIQIEVTKCTVLKMKLTQVALHVDKIGDDQYLMIANEMLLPEGKKLNNIQVIREKSNKEQT